MGYKRDKEVQVIELEFQFDQERHIQGIIEEFQNILKTYKEKYGDLLIACMLEEKRVGYEDWYWVVSVRYWESEVQYNNRIAMEKAIEEKERQKEKARLEKEAHNQAISDQIKALQSQYKK